MGYMGSSSTWAGGAQGSGGTSFDPGYAPASAAPGTFLPDPSDTSAMPTEMDSWIGGAEGDVTRKYFSGARVTGQARPRL